MNTCALITLGCKVNQYETESIRESLLARGLREAPKGTKADLYVINTCAVTSVSAEKSRRAIRRAVRANPAATVIATGCYAEAEPDAVRRIEGVDYVVPQSRKHELFSLLDAVVGAAAGGETPGRLIDAQICRFAGHTRAFLKVQDGCDARCAYCIVPKLRGRSTSRPLESIRAEAERLVEAGHLEIVLTGIHLGAYGTDLAGRTSLEDAVRIVLATPGIRRVRLSSIEATEVSDELIRLAANDPKFCPHFHLPLQSGSSDVLRRMGRPYSARDYLRVTERIRAALDRPSFGGDVMVGFPGETEADFEETLRVCRHAGFARTHVFPFSPREGTAAARMTNQCAPELIKERKRRLLQLADELALEYKRQFCGETLEVLVESMRDARSGMLQGYTSRYVRVLFDGPDDIMARFVNVRGERATPQHVLGVVAAPPVLETGVSSPAQPA